MQARCTLIGILRDSKHCNLFVQINRCQVSFNGLQHYHMEHIPGPHRSLQIFYMKKPFCVANHVGRRTSDPWDVSVCIRACKGHIIPGSGVKRGPQRNFVPPDEILSGPGTHHLDDHV